MRGGAAPGRRRPPAARSRPAWSSHRRDPPRRWSTTWSSGRRRWSARRGGRGRWRRWKPRRRRCEGTYSMRRTSGAARSAPSMPRLSTWVIMRPWICSSLGCCSSFISLCCLCFDQKSTKLHIISRHLSDSSQNLDLFFCFICFCSMSCCFISQNPDTGVPPPPPSFSSF